MRRTVWRWRATAVGALVASALALGGCAGSMGERATTATDDGMGKGDMMMEKKP